MHHCYFNGTIMPADEVKLHHTDLGLLRGYGMFDYFRTYNGKPFQWDWYWERYERSAKLLRIPNPIDKEKAHEVVMKLIGLSGLSDCSFRFVLTGGYAPDSMSMKEPNLMIISEDLHANIPQEYETGIKVITYEFVRDIPEIKSTDYKHLLILQPDIKAAGAQDVLYHKNGDISELSRSNVFIFKNDVLITPDENALKGITRRTVLELAKPHFKIEIRPVSLQELLDADEVFTTSTTKRVLPITTVDDKKINGGVVGKNSKLLLELINDLIKNW
jgi:branched-chain amino acid aminotransferase